MHQNLTSRIRGVWPINWYGNSATNSITWYHLFFLPTWSAIPRKELRPQTTPPQHLANSKCKTRCTASSESSRRVTNPRIRGFPWRFIVGSQFERPIDFLPSPKHQPQNHGKKRINLWGVDLSDSLQRFPSQISPQAPFKLQISKPKQKLKSFWEEIWVKLPNC